MRRFDGHVLCATLAKDPYAYPEVLTLDHPNRYQGGTMRN